MPRALFRHAQVEREGDQPLLGAVVEVPLDAAALGVGGLDDAAAGVAQVGHPGSDRGIVIRAEQQLGVGAVEAAERAEGGDADPDHERAERAEGERLGQGVDFDQPPQAPVGVVGDGPVPERQRQVPHAHGHDGGGDDEGHEAEGELQEQEGQVLPGGGVGEAGAQALPPATVRKRAVGARDDVAG
jgi:hypothetical protein